VDLHLNTGANAAQLLVDCLQQGADASLPHLVLVQPCQLYGHVSVHHLQFLLDQFLHLIALWDNKVHSWFCLAKTVLLRRCFALVLRLHKIFSRYMDHILGDVRLPSSILAPMHPQTPHCKRGGMERLCERTCCLRLGFEGFGKIAYLVHHCDHFFGHVSFVLRNKTGRGERSLLIRGSSV